MKDLSEQRHEQSRREELHPGLTIRDSLMGFKRFGLKPYYKAQGGNGHYKNIGLQNVVLSVESKIEVIP